MPLDDSYERLAWPIPLLLAYSGLWYPRRVTRRSGHISATTPGEMKDQLSGETLPRISAAEIRLQKLIATILPDRRPQHLDELSEILQEARRVPPSHRVQFCRDVNLLLDVLDATISVSVGHSEQPARLVVSPSTDAGSIQFKAPSGDSFGGFMAGESQRHRPGRPPAPKLFSVKKL